MVIVKKRDTEDIRVCVDLTHLNRAVARENHPMPVVKHILDQMPGAKYFSKLRQWILASANVGKISIIDNIYHSVWKILLFTLTFWNLVGTGALSETNVKNPEGLRRCD